MIGSQETCPSWAALCQAFSLSRPSQPGHLVSKGQLLLTLCFCFPDQASLHAHTGGTETTGRDLRPEQVQVQLAEAI